MLTKKEMEIVTDNLSAFIANFGAVRIERADYGKGLYVYSPADSESYVQYCYDVNYLNGWLYGCVQAVNGIVKSIRK